MDAPNTFSRARVGVTDLEAAVEFYRDRAGLGITEMSDDRAYLHAGPEHHCLEVVPALSGGVLRFGYAVSAQYLANAAEWLDQAGIGYQEETPVSAGESIAFADPDNNTIEFHTDPLEMAARPRRRLSPSKLLHPLLNVEDLPQAVEFYTGLGFLVSDRIDEKAAFLRCNDGFHHSLALQQADSETPPGVDHLCFHVDDFDELMRLRARIRTTGEGLQGDVVRHGGSESVSYYFADPHTGIDWEYCSGHRKIHSSGHMPRVLPAEPETFDMWQRFD